MCNKKEYLYKALKIGHSFVLLCGLLLMTQYSCHLLLSLFIVFVNNIRNLLFFEYHFSFSFVIFLRVFFLHNDCLKSDCGIGNTFVIYFNKTKKKTKLKKFQQFRRFTLNDGLFQEQKINAMKKN